MGVISNNLVEDAKVYVASMLDKNLSEKFYYHNIKHTFEVLNNAEIIGKYYGLGITKYNLLRLSALFHDLGYIDQYRGHEEKSAVYAAEFLQSKSVSKANTEQVIRAIMATKMPQQPADKISEILCDADLMYLADPANYFEDAEMLRLEWSAMKIANYSEKEFAEISINFFETHVYHTEYGRKILQQKKNHNKMLIREKILESR